MPQLDNITVKKNDGTTDIQWTGVVASSGDSSPAILRSNTVGTADAHRPTLQMRARDNANKTLRRTDVIVSFPEALVGGDGITRIANTATVTVSVAIPKGMSDTTRDEAVSQSMNLLASTLIKSAFKGGYSLT